MEKYDNPTITVPNLAEPKVSAVAIDEEAVAIPVLSVEHVIPVPPNESSPLTASQEQHPQAQTGAPNNGNNKNSAQIIDDDEGCDCLCCGDTKVRRVRPGSNCYASVCGNTHVDLRGQPLPPGSNIKLIVVRLCGDTRVYVPRGTRVSVRRLLLCGDKDVQLEDPIDEEGLLDDPLPCVTIYVFMLCGSIRVRSEGLVKECKSWKDAFESIWNS